MFIMDSPTKKYNLLGDARPVSVGPTEKAKQEHLRSAINLKPNRTEGLPTLQESKGRIHPQPSLPIKQRDPALSKSALSTSRSSHEASINTQQQQKICVVSNVVEFEFGYLKLLQDANHANTKVLLKIPQSPLYSPIVELLTFCSSWCCVKILRTVGILSARVKLNSFYAVTELAPQLSGLCAEVFKQYLAEHPSYKTQIGRQEMDNPTFKKTLEQHYSKAMRDFSTSTQKTLLSSLCQNTNVNLSAVPLNRINEQLTSTLMSLVMILNSSAKGVKFDPHLITDLKKLVGLNQLVIEMEKLQPLVKTKEGNEKTQIQVLDLAEIQNVALSSRKLEDLYNQAVQKIAEASSSSSLKAGETLKHSDNSRNQRLGQPVARNYNQPSGVGIPPGHQTRNHRG